MRKGWVWCVLTLVASTGCDHSHQSAEHSNAAEFQQGHAAQPASSAAQDNPRLISISKTDIAKLRLYRYKAEIPCTTAFYSLSTLALGGKPPKGVSYESIANKLDGQNAASAKEFAQLMHDLAAFPRLAEAVRGHRDVINKCDGPHLVYEASSEAELESWKSGHDEELSTAWARVETELSLAPTKD